MKINWKENPLETTVDLDDNDRQRLVLFLQNEAYVEILCDLTLTLEKDIRQDSSLPTHDEILKRTAKWRQICDMDETHPDVKMLESELQYSHGGDCTCWAASCMKCMAEYALGINTIKGLGQHEASNIMGVFQKYKSIDDAISYLTTDKEYVKPDNWPDSVGYEVHIPRWDAERVRALEWLRNYKKEHNF